VKELATEPGSLEINRWRTEAELIHRLALSWVAEGRPEAGLPLWRAAIEAADHIGTAAPTRLDQVSKSVKACCFDLLPPPLKQVRHAKAVIGCCINAARGDGAIRGDDEV